MAVWPRPFPGDLRPWAVVTGGLVELVLPLEETVVLVTGFFTGTVVLGAGCVVAVDAGRVVALFVLVE